MRIPGVGASTSQTLKRFLRFGLVGASGVLVDMGVLYLLADPQTLGWALSLSKVIAAETAIVNNFVWNELWTFRDISTSRTDWKSRADRFTRFNLICLAGIGISVLLLNFQVHFLHLNVYVANLLAIALASFWNFWMNIKFGWTQPTVSQFEVNPKPLAKSA